MAPRPDRAWIAGGVAGGVTIAALGWFLAINPELSKTSSLRDSTVATQDQNTVLQRKVRKLRADNANIGKLTGVLKEVRLGLPADSGMPDFTRQLAKQATTAVVLVASIDAAAPVGVEAATAPTTKGAAPAKPAPAAPAGSAKSGSAAPAAKLFSIPVTVVSEGTVQHLRAFLDAIQVKGPRRVLVGSVQMAPTLDVVTASPSANWTMTVSLQVFVAPQTPAGAIQLQQQLGGRPG
jgi:hypothetical protein